MAGVGSTNAMKKGSGNNPFLAFSEADMQGYLNSAYTGCIVKYSGEAIKRQITDINKTVGEYAQNLVFDTTKLGVGAIVLPAAIKIDITKNGASTTQYIYEGWVKDGKVYANAVTGSTNMLVLASSLNSGADVITVINNGRWQREAVNDQGKLTLWSYSEDVLFTVIPDANGSLAPFERFVSIVPYIVGELYKVVYGDGVYYFEEFYYISEDRTTGNSDYLAPGKTMYDFTGSLQTGNGSKINPYIANTVDEMNSYLTLSYKGAFVKYVGTSTADYTKDAVYQVAEDGDTTRYAILPTLSNPADPIDVAEGKEAINQLGVKMVGTGNVVLRAATTAGMQALFTTENIGKVVQYVGETDVYIKDAIYQIVDTSEFKQYYELPTLTNEATADDLALGKELINSKGEKVIGTASGGGVEIITGSILPDTSGVKSIIIAGISRRPKIIAAYAPGITSSSSIGAIVSDPACANEGATSNSMWVISGTTGNSTKRYSATFDYDEANQTVTLNAGDLSFVRFPLPYAIAY